MKPNRPSVTPQPPQNPASNSPSNPASNNPSNTPPNKPINPATSHPDDEIHAFEEDVAYFVNVLKESFESDKASYYLDDQNDTLYIELEGLSDYTEEEIAEIAEPIFEELDLDVEEIHLLPLSG